MEVTKFGEEMEELMMIKAEQFGIIVEILSKQFGE